MRKVSARVKGFVLRTIARVVLLEQLTKEWKSELQYLVRITSYCETEKLNALMQAGLNNVALLTASKESFEAWYGPAVFEDRGALWTGDVVAVSENINHAHILIRESDQHHTVFLTNRCNRGQLTKRKKSYAKPRAASVAAGKHYHWA
nr:hypothetical protein [uncultured Halomonas sp.]